ncbi:MAG: site-2 protease family protein, partial [Planctomycetales bacterium]|nr:site-2 protease family protein [Planctomycetales bacterium]
ELGHFAVAKMCGVKCEKFFIGFDIGGYKLSRKWGETEYGIGILPLGGYVKMLGQDDDPSKIAEQMQESEASAKGLDDSKTKLITGPSGKQYRVDRRSYQAKTVPQRMAIISAGVIMNLIFGFIFAVIAYAAGAEYEPCVVGYTSPGSPAYMAGLETGDEILELNDRREPSFGRLTQDVVLGDKDQGVKCVVKRAATDEIETLVLKPRLEQSGLKIGVGPMLITTLSDLTPAASGTPAAEADLKPGDKVIGINGVSTPDFPSVMESLTSLHSEPITVTVERQTKGSEEPTTDTVTVAPAQFKRLGAVMAMGPITAVQPGSPGAEAGLKAGDLITAINDRPVGAAPAGERNWDPSTLPQLIRNETGDLKVTVQRGEEQLELTVAPREVTWFEVPGSLGSPMPLAGLGVTYQIRPEVVSLVEGSPAAEELQVGDVVTSFLVIPPEGVKKEMKGPVTIDEEHQNWPHFIGYFLQRWPLDSKVRLTVKRGEQEREVTLGLMPAEGVYLDERGFNFMPLTRIRQGKSFGEVVYLGADRLWSDLTGIFRVLQRIGSDQVPMKTVSGPIGILYFAYQIAHENFVRFLLFLTMLSANLAVLNFLPIPVLDGGHMVFLTYEGLRGRPANERVTMLLHMAGLFFLLTLMVLAISNDVRNIFF